ncbi:FeoB small GTPase domain-containing protein [Desulfotomaculum defluvii]
MGLTYQSCGTSIKKDLREAKARFQYEIALAGNPNTGKTTLFNRLTGLKQHTGNWPGKTVLRSEGKFLHDGLKYNLIDLPGIYSLLANSPEEQVAREYLCFGKPDATVIVLDATCLERNMNLALQILEITSNVVVCVNLIDEAKRKNIYVNIDMLSSELGVPVVPTIARDGIGIPQLLDVMSKIVRGMIVPTPYIVQYTPLIEESIKKLEPAIIDLVGQEFNTRWLALRLLEQDQTVINTLYNWVLQKDSLPGEGAILHEPIAFV